MSVQSLKSAVRRGVTPWQKLRSDPGVESPWKSLRIALVSSLFLQPSPGNPRMKTSLVQNIWAGAALLALSITGYALHPVDVPPPVSSTDRAGLQLTLKTSGYRFVVSPPPVVAHATQRDHAVILPPIPPPLDSFPASVTLYNRSNSDIRFRFETAEAAAQRFVFRVFNSAGDKVWESTAIDAPASPAADPVDVILQRRGTWRRLVQVPLRPGGTALPAGTYTLEAVIDADKQMGGSVLFEVVAQEPPPPPPPPATTGLRGLVLRPTGVPPNSASLLPTEVPASGAILQIGEVVDDLSTRPSRHWTTRTDANGRFQIELPPGDYRVVVERMAERPWLPMQVEEPTSPPPPSHRVLPPTEFKTVEATVEQGRFTELTIRLVQRVAPPPGDARLVAAVQEVEIRPSPLTEISAAVVWARGVVSSGGWTNPQLRFRGVTNDGIVEFLFVAVPPRGPATAVMTPVEASTGFRKPENFRGVRVIAHNNSKEALAQEPR